MNRRTIWIVGLISTLMFFSLACSEEDTSGNSASDILFEDGQSQDTEGDTSTLQDSVDSDIPDATLDTSEGQDSSSNDTSPQDTHGDTLSGDTSSGDTSSGDTLSEDTGPSQDTSDAGDVVDPPFIDGRAEHCAQISGAIRAEGGGALIIAAPAGPGLVTVDGATMTLRQAVNSAQPGDIVALEDGVYTFPESDGGSYTGLYFTTPGITLRSLSGDASAVILDSAYADHGGSTAPITISAPNITLADFSIRRSIFHLVHFSGGEGDVGRIHNLHLVDGGQQFIKSSSGSDRVEGVSISCSTFLMTDEGRDNVWGYGATDGGTTCYTGGIDTHEASDWVVSDNHFEGIYCNPDGVLRPVHGKKSDVRGGTLYTGGLAEHAIHMWDSPEGTGHLIERNRIVDCARGIGVGFNTEVYGAVVRNNMIFSKHAGSREHDIAISLERAHDSQIYNNTIYSSHPDAYANSIEYRWGSTQNLEISNNLISHALKARNSAVAVTSNNVLAAQGAWFIDPIGGDLHLDDCEQSEIIGQGIALSGLSVDFDHEDRPSSVDVGADQCIAP